MQDTQSSYIFAFDGKRVSRINRQGASSRKLTYDKNYIPVCSA